MPTLYRATQANPPTVADFMSNKAKGKARRIDVETEDDWAGLSTFDTAERCRRKSAQFSLGHYVAEVVIPEGSAIRVGPVAKGGHCSVWGEPEEFLRYVGAITPVAQEQGRKI